MAMAWKGSRAKPPERHGKLATCVSARGARAAGSAGAFPLNQCRGVWAVLARERNNVSLTRHGRHEKHARGRVRRPAAAGEDVSRPRCLPHHGEICHTTCWFVCSSLFLYK